MPFLWDTFPPNQETYDEIREVIKELEEMDKEVLDHVNDVMTVSQWPTIPGLCCSSDNAEEQDKFHENLRKLDLAIGDVRLLMAYAKMGYLQLKEKVNE